MIVTTLGPRGVQSTRTSGSTIRGDRIRFTTVSLGLMFEQHDSGKPLHLLAALLGAEARHQFPQPRHLRRSRESDGFVEDLAVFLFTPARGLEELGALGRREDHRRVPLAELAAPCLLQELEERR